MYKLFLLSIFFTFQGLAQDDCGDTPVLNSQIVKLAKGKLKKRVGRGECWDLAQYVLNEVDAEWDGFEVYGNLIDQEDECIFPGDIIQFEKIKIEYEQDGFIYSESMSHHTAIIYKVLNDNEVVLLHQNTADHGRKVGQSNLKFDSVISGKLLIYRPIN
jgi:hypothetical protein